LNDLNQTSLEGNITKDPESRSTPNGTLISTFSIATNRYFKNGDEATERETSFFEIEAWGKLAENCITLAHKGRGCRIFGRLKQERWIGPDGKPRSKIILVAKEIEYKPDRHGKDNRYE